MPKIEDVVIRELNKRPHMKEEILRDYFSLMTTLMSENDKNKSDS